MLDSLLAGGLLLVALGVLLARQLYQAVVMLIAFGLLMALVWMRLDAPDLALAEAAIGAGLTGVLFLDALGHLRVQSTPGSASRVDQALLLSLSGILALLLAWTLLSEPVGRVNLMAQVVDTMPLTGVEHDITAVLLAFRAYDTLLEVAVVLVAVVVGWALRSSHADQPVARGLNSSLLRTTLAWLVPVMLLVGGYILWIGSYRSGGAFQAAAILAAALVLLKLAGWSVHQWIHRAQWRYASVIGLGFFIAMGGLSQFWGGMFLQWPTAYSGGFILAIETLLTFSLAVLLYSLFEASPAAEPIHAADLSIS